MRTSPVATLMGVSFLWLLTAGLTVAGFFAFVIPEDRNTTFYAVMISDVLAELILFGYMAYLATVPRTVTRPSLATRYRVLSLIGIWFVIVFAMGFVAAHPSRADTFFSDKIVFFNLAATLLMAFVASAVQRQDVAIQVRHDAPQRERARVQAYAGGIQSAMAAVRAAAVADAPERADADRLLKRLDTLKTQLLGFSPEAARETARQAQPVPVAEIESGLSRLQDRVDALRSATADQVGGAVSELAKATEDLLALTRNRETTLRF